MSDIKAMSLDELFAQLGDRSGSSDNSEDNSLTDKARVAFLLEGLSEFMQPVPDFKVGDIVRGKNTLTMHLRNSRKPHIVMELLDKPVTVAINHEGIGMPAAAGRYDMVVGAAITAGKKMSLARYVSDRREWELYPEPEKLKPSHS